MESSRSASPPGLSRNSARSSRRAAKTGRDASGSAEAGGYGHQAGHPDALAAPAFLQERGDPIGSHAPLLGLSTEVHLDQDIEVALGEGRPVVELPGHLDAVHGFHAVEQACHVAGLVPLELADEVPARRGRARLSQHRLDLRDLVAGLLGEVLRDVVETGADGVGDSLGRLALADSENHHLSGIASRPQRRGLRALADRAESLREPPTQRPGISTPASCSIARVSSRGSPITLVSLPSTPAMKRRPAPCRA